MKTDKFFSHLKIENQTRKIKKGSEKELRIHLKNVAERIIHEIDSKTFNLPFDKKHLKNIGYLSGIAHDFGKYTTYFQKMLRGEIKKCSLSSHGFISALFGFYLVDNYIKNNDISNESHVKYLPLISFHIIKHHHGNLEKLSQDVLFDNQYAILEKQIADIKKNELRISEDYKKLIKDDINLSGFFKQFFPANSYTYKYQIESSLNKQQYLFSKSENGESLKEFYFLINQYLYSLLISNDKLDAANLDINPYIDLDSQLVDRYKQNTFGLTTDLIQKNNKKDISKMTLNELREKIYQEINKKIKKIDLQQEKIFTITSPTGTGKTFSALNAALKIKEELNTEDTPYKIIYALPFTSIIEQNYSTIEEILDNQYHEEFKKNKSAYLIKHHYFSNPEYVYESKYCEIEKALLYIENWDSAIITTTFVQLFSTLIGYKNKALKKFHSLTNSIIILDEVQNIPFKYWKIVNKILKMLSDKFNSYIILLTATKPLIFSKEESIELLENHKSFYALDNLNRTHITETNIDTVAQLIDHLSNEINNSNLIMIVSNTISSTLEIFKEISGNDKFDQFQKIYLSTNITPYERLQRIYKIKDKVFDKAIIITTQLIEAGVDIDVDVIYRDFAPLDSIIQAAGRANRNGSHEKTGEIKLMNLIDEKRNNEITLSSYIYGKTNLQATENSIEKEFEEKTFLKIIGKYFEELSKKKSQIESDKLEDSMREFYFFDKYSDKKILPISEFKLIDNLPNYVSLFVNINKKSKETWQAFIALENIEDPIKRKNEFKRIKGEFSKYTINIPEKHTQVCEPIIQSNLYYFDANLDKNNENYDKTENSGTGLKREISNWIM